MELKKGECICPKCNGTGTNGFCFNCNGTGKVDWVTKIIPKRLVFELPKIRAKYPKLISEEIVSAQPIAFEVKTENKE